MNHMRTINTEGWSNATGVMNIQVSSDVWQYGQSFEREEMKIGDAYCANMLFRSKIQKHLVMELVSI